MDPFDIALRPVAGNVISKALGNKLEKLGIECDSPDFLFEGANGMGGGQLVRQGEPYLTAYANALSLSRKEFLLLLRERASMGERLHSMYYSHLIEYGLNSELNDLRETGVIDETEYENQRKMYERK